MYVGAVFRHPILARNAGIENAVLYVPGHLLGPAYETLDPVIIDFGEVAPFGER